MTLVDGGRTAPPPEDAQRRANALVESHIGLARHLAARFADRGEQLDDLIQVAYLGLVKAARRFDVDRNVRFTTFATATITGELKRHFRDRRWTMRVARTTQELYLEVRAAAEQLTHRLGRSPTIAELAADVGATEEAVVDALGAARSFRLGSLDATSEDHDDPLGARLPSFDEGFGEVERRRLSDALLGRLPPREQQVVRLRYVHDLTQAQIAERLGLSQMHVSRLLSRSLGQLVAWADEQRAGQAGTA